MNEIDSLSYRATLMCRDIPVGEIQARRVTPIRPELLPLYFQRGGDLGVWLEQRAIDAHRTHSRLVKKALRLRERDDISTTLHFNAATITDSYWIRPENSSLTWDQVRFKENEFADLALTGDLAAFSKHPSRTPELTNIGSYEKCWRYENGAWWMYKAGTVWERFSELFIYNLCRELHFPTAEYQPAGEFIKTRDFTEGTMNFEPAFALVGDEEDYSTNYQAFLELGTAYADQYVELLLMDTFCRNADRHTLNYGVLRDPLSGRLLSLAPNFDNNIALISDGKLIPRKPDLFGELLRELEESDGAISSYAERHPLPVITPAMIARCCEKTGFDVDVSFLQQFVMTGYEQTPIPQMLEQQPTLCALCTGAQQKAAERNAGKAPATDPAQHELSQTN